MKLYSFQVQQQRKIGAELDGQLVDLSAGYSAWMAAYGPRDGALRAIPSDMLSFIRLGKLALDAARETLSYFSKRPALPVGEEVVFSFDAVKLLPPVPRPGKILCCSTGTKAPGNPGSSCTAIKFASSVIGPGETVFLPNDLRGVQPGPALALVIGKRCRHVDKGGALKSAFGYTILNDIHAPARSVPLGNDALLSRNFDTFCPIGPCIVTSDELPEVAGLTIALRVNGNVIAENPMETGLEECVSMLSGILTLEPGDIVAAGPAHPPHGAAPSLLAPGDEMEVEIDGAGRLFNRVMVEP